MITTFLIENLHCPSCVTNIQQTLAHLDSQIVLHSCSIVSHSVSLRHGRSLSVPIIAQAFEDAGFKIQSVAQEHDGEIQLYEKQEKGKVRSDYRISGLNFQPWHSEPTRQEILLRRKETHSRRCDECHVSQKLAYAASELEEDRRSFDEENQKSALNGHRDVPGKNSFIITAPPDPLLHSVISVDGMSCSSCVGKIKETLESKAWIAEVEVSLLSGSAAVKYHGADHLPEIIEALEDIGFDAAVQSTRNLSQAMKSKRPSVDRWKATYSVRGMSCSSCVAKISSALKELEWVEEADVSLVSHTATVIFSGKSHKEDIIALVREIGDYRFELVSAEPASSLPGSEEADHDRKIIINVNGMHCPACPQRITNALENLDDSLKVEQPIDLKNPKIRITYSPRSPCFTIRDILANISSIDPCFRVSIYHPPTLEDRARKLQRRHQLQILYRLILALVVAIPTTVIGIVYMMVVSESNSTRQYFEEPIWVGRVSRGEWASFIMTTVVYFFAADLFHRRMLMEMWLLWKPGSKTPIFRRFYKFGSMDTLISLGTSVAYFASVAQLGLSATDTTGETEMDHKSSFFDAVVFLTFFLLCGRLIEALSKAKAGNAVALLCNLRPAEANLVTDDGHTITIPTDQLENGDIVRVNIGASPPSDGIVTEGQSYNFDESSLTGEAKAVMKKQGDTAYTGTINRGTPILIRVTGVGGQSMLDQIINVVRDGQTRRAPVERLADILTGYFVPVVTFIAITVWLIWNILGLAGALPDDYLDVQTGGWTFWSLQFAIAVFVVACPCGIGLAAPTAIFVGTGLGAKHGVLVKSGGEAFQTTSKVNCIVFDKTGTLTTGGNPVTTDHRFLGPEGGVYMRDDGRHISEPTQQMALGMARAIEEASDHPLAKAVVNFARSQQEERFGTLVYVDEIAGKGMKGRVRFNTLTTTDDTVSTSDTAGERSRDEGIREFEVLLGNERLIVEHDLHLSEDVTATLIRWKRQAKSVILMASRDISAAIASNPSGSNIDVTHENTQWELTLIMAASDPIRPESASVVRKFQSEGIETWMLSGDNAITAQAVASVVGIPLEKVIAGVLPDQKAAKIKHLQSEVVSPKTSSDRTNGTSRGPLARFFHRLALSPFQSLLRRLSIRSRKSKPHGQDRQIVAMVGDGINDSPALTAADIGIAISSGADIALAAADFVLIAPGLNPLLTAFQLSRKVFTRIKFNFGWALVYNCVAVPVAAGVLYPLKTGEGGIEGEGEHVRLDPVWASLAMALSSVSVVVSSLALRWWIVGGFRVRGVDTTGVYEEAEEAEAAEKGTRDEDTEEARRKALNKIA